MSNFWRWFFLLICAFLLINFISLTNNPPIWPDEAIMAEYAFNLDNQGKLISSLHGSMYRADKGLFFYPPMLPILLAGVFKLTGLSIISQRLLALFFGLLLFVIILKLVKQPSITWLTTLWLTDFSLMRASHFSRPEIFVLSLTFVSLSLLFSRYRFHEFFASLISVLSFLIHPLGIITVLLCGLFQLYKRNFKQLFILTGLLILGIFLWFWMINFQLAPLLLVLKLQAQRRLSEPSFFDFIKQSNLLYFALVYYLYFGISIFLLIYFLIKKRLDLQIRLLIFGLFLSWLLVFYGREPWYYVYPLPFMYFLWFKFWKTIESDFGKISFGIISLTIIFCNLNLMNLDWRSNQGSYSKLTQSLLDQLPQNSTVFLSSIPDPYYHLKTSDKNLTIYQFAPLPEKKSEYYKLLDNSDYVIFTGYLDYGFNDLLKRYLEKNTKKIVAINNGQGEYQASLVRLVSKNKRQVN